MSFSEGRGPLGAESRELVRSIQSTSLDLLGGVSDRDAALKERLAMLRRLVALHSPAEAARLLGVSTERVEQELRNDPSFE